MSSIPSINRFEFEHLEQRRLLSGNPAISISDVALVEGQNGTTAFVFTVSLSNASRKQVSVTFTTEGSSAQAGSDYAHTSGTLKFAPGQTARQISVLVNGDTVAENDEMFLVKLSNARNGGITRGSGVGTIINDDAAPSPPPGVPVDNAGQPQPVNCPDCYLYEGWWRPVQPPQDPDFVF